MNHLGQSNLETHEIVLQILTAIFTNDELKPDCLSFTELLTLKVALAFCDPRRQVIISVKEFRRQFRICFLVGC